MSTLLMSEVSAKVTSAAGPVADRIRAVVNAIAEGLEGEETMLISSHELGSAIHRAGILSSDLQQTTDYTQYILRETPHVCRHAIGGGVGMYRLHAAEQCSDACDAKYDAHQVTSHPTHRVCAQCGMEIPYALEKCEWC